MLRSIALTNFKAYGRLDELELRPLTVFCGPNAVGKSSVIQALLMMRQTIDKAEQTPAWSSRLVTDGNNVSLGDYIDVVFGHDIGRTLATELTVQVPGDKAHGLGTGFWKEQTTVTLLTKYWIPYYGGIGPEPGAWEALHSRNCVPQICHLRLSARGSDGRELVTVDATEPNLGNMDVALTFGEDLKHADRHFYAEHGSFSLRGLHFSGRVIETTPDGHALEADEKSGVCFDDSGSGTRYPAITLTEWNDDCGAEELVGLVSRMLVEVSSRLTVRYVGAAREAPQRYYDMDKGSMVAGVGRGERDWKMDLAFSSPNVRKPQTPTTHKPSRFEHMINGDGSVSLQIGAIYAGNLGDTINAWLKDLGLPEVHPVLEGRDFRVMVSSPYAEKCSVSVADTGYGVSQVLPVLLAGAASRDEILVLDQPELHLHPKLQTGMADFAIAVSETRQVLVETHSDHFVNRIVRRVVEGQISSDDVAVYFFTPTSDGPHVEMVEVDPTFGIKNWPLGFFDDYADEQEAIIRASLKRRAEEGRN